MGRSISREINDDLKVIPICRRSVRPWAPVARLIFLNGVRGGNWRKDVSIDL